MQNKISAVKKFHKSFKIGYLEEPTANLGKDKNNLRYNLMAEENSEYLEAANNGDLEVMNKLLTVLEKPYENQNSIIDFQSPAPSSDKAYQTFCGT